MNIKCPNCETIFEVKDFSLKQDVINFKCSVCSNRWKHKVKVNAYENNERENRLSYKQLIFFNFFLIILFLSLTILLNEDFMYIDNYLQNFYNFIDDLVPIK